MPASSRIRNSLNLSRKLFLAGRFVPLVPSDSLPSSNLLNINSGLLPTVAIEDAVFLRSLFGEGRGGEVTASLGVDVFRESHEKGLVSFLDTGAGL